MTHVTGPSEECLPYWLSTLQMKTGLGGLGTTSICIMCNPNSQGSWQSRWCPQPSLPKAFAIYSSSQGLGPAFKWPQVPDPDLPLSCSVNPLVCVVALTMVFHALVPRFQTKMGFTLISSTILVHTTYTACFLGVFSLHSKGEKKRLSSKIK